MTTTRLLATYQALRRWSVGEGQIYCDKELMRDILDDLEVLWGIAIQSDHGIDPQHGDSMREVMQDLNRHRIVGHNRKGQSIVVAPLTWEQMQALRSWMNALYQRSLDEALIAAQVRQLEARSRHMVDRPDGNPS